MHASNALVCMNTSQGAQTEGVGKRDIRVIVNTYSYNLSLSHLRVTHLINYSKSDRSKCDVACL
jgi:hypothetical protein